MRALAFSVGFIAGCIYLAALALVPITLVGILVTLIVK